MKRIIFTLTGLFLSAVPVTALHAQDNRISLKMDNVPLVRILDRIEEVSDYTFLYNKQIVDVDRTSSLDVTNAALSDILPRLFAGTGIGYTVEGRQIVLAAKRQENGTAGQRLAALSGRVVDDATDAPLAGVTVAVEGTSYGAVTDGDGRFSMQLPVGSTVSVICLGYATRRIVFEEQREVTVRLQEELNLFDEVVVVGYGTTTKKNLTTAISQVKPDNVPQAANSNLNQLLMGRAAGLQATVNTGQPDGKVNVSIRGGGTPIYVVDGVIMPSNAISLGGGETGIPSNVDRAGMAGINPSDIESIEVLKDASAAIYGIRAANGVILITTKKGSEGKPRVTYDGSYTWVRNYPYADMLDAREYMNFSNIFSKENYLYNRGMYPYGGLEYDGGWSPLFPGSVIANAKTTDWQDYALKNGYITNHNVTISGGIKAFSYYIGGNFFDQDGTVVNSGMRKFALRTNLGVQIFPFLRITTVLNANQNSYDNSMVGTDTGNRGNLAASSLYAAMMYPPYLPEKTPTEAIRSTMTPLTRARCARSRTGQKRTATRLTSRPTSTCGKSTSN